MLISLLFLLGCPEPPESTSSEQSQSNTLEIYDKVTDSRNNSATTQGKTSSKDVKGGYPTNNGEIITESILIRLNNSGQDDNMVRVTQQQLQKQSHVKLSGSIICNGEGCDSPMVIRILHFGQTNHEELSVFEKKVMQITSKTFSSTGPYSILIPTSKIPIVMEVLVDENKDGIPSIGERMAILDRGGRIIPEKNLSDLNFDTTDRKIETPIGGPRPPDDSPPVDVPK